MGLSVQQRLDNYKNLRKDYFELLELFKIHKKNNKIIENDLKLAQRRLRKQTSDAPKNPSQNDLIKYELESLLEIGVTSKDSLFTSVEKTLKVKRPTVRRVAREMRLFYIESVKILSVDIDKNKKTPERFLSD